MEKDDHKLCFCIKQGLKEHNIGIKWGLQTNFLIFPKSYPFSQKSGFLGGMKSGVLLYQLNQFEARITFGFSSRLNETPAG